MTRAEVERAFTAHKDAVYRFAWRMAPDAADDIAQEVFVRLLRGQVQFDDARGSLRGFLLGVARNLALQHLRSNARWDSLDEEQFAAGPITEVRLKPDTTTVALKPDTTIVRLKPDATYRNSAVASLVSSCR